MKVSYNWLNDFLENKAPRPEKIMDLLTMNSMEVENLEKLADDFLLDVKTLPNNNHSCLCHRGIAREIGVLASLKVNNFSRNYQNIKVGITSKKLEVKIADPKLCRRYIGRIVENIRVDKSPKWLVDRLEALGQRSICNIVDATNFVMFELGQPMHAFDADKLLEKSNQILIDIKNAKVGEMITTLDRKDVILDESVLLITAKDKPLAIAGIKGGTYAELDEKTVNIVLESANFDPVLIRKTAQKIKIQTEASKRYENDFTPVIAEEAMDILTKLIVEIAGTKDTKVGEIVDCYPNKIEKSFVSVSTKEVNKIIGIEISEKEIEDIFRRFNFIYKKTNDNFTVEIPDERLDLRIKEDLAEEIGRVYGYEKIKELNPRKTNFVPKIDKTLFYKNKIRNILVAEGFSEVINYTFSDQGEEEVINSMSPERRFLRTDLTRGLTKSLEFNSHYSELIDMTQIKIFEFGHVFVGGRELERFVIGVKNPIGLKKPREKETLDLIIKILAEKISLNLVRLNNLENIAEFDLSSIVSNLPEVNAYDKYYITDQNIKFKSISDYPFILRDIAVFTPEITTPEMVLKIILEEAGDLMVKYRLFDTYKKDEKVSYAYRLVFQSHDRTLSDEEINKIMSRITSKLNNQTGWQVR